MPLKNHRISDQAFDSFLSLCSDQPGLLDAEADLHAQTWDALLSHRNALNAARRDLRVECSGRAMDADERATLATISELIEDVQAEIQLRDDLGDKAPRASASRGRKSAADGVDDPAHPLTGGTAADRVPLGRVQPVLDMAAPVVTPSFARLFGAPPRAERRDDRDGFACFLNAIAMNDSQYLRDVRYRAATGGSTLTGEGGGFAVPTPLAADLLSLVVEQSQFLSLCRVLPMEGKTTTYPILNVRDRTRGPGKLEGKRQGEGQTGTYQVPKMEDLVLTANKRVVLWSCTAEQLQDSLPGTDAALMQSAAGALAMEIDREIIAGSGVAEGLGVLNSACLIVHGKDGGQSASTVSFTNLSGMVARLAPRSFNAAVWVVNQTVLPQLFGVYLATGASGGIPAPLTQLPDGTYRLFGRPLIVSDFAPALSAKGDVMLLDLSWLAVGMREDLRFEVSRDALFSSDEVAFKLVRRSDVKAILPGAITPANGSNTLSPFVALEAR